MPTLSVVIPVYNEIKYLERVIARVENAKIPEGVDRQIVCVDDCSTDEPANTAPYDCPVEGIAGSDPWHVYRLAEGCWLHGNPPICDDDGCAPAVTRGVQQADGARPEGEA